MENKITPEQIEAKIKAECYLVLPDGRSTICLLSLENGYTIKGLSACVDASNFDMDMGRKIAREDAVRQIWPLEGYLLAQRMHEKKSQPMSTITIRAEGEPVYTETEIKVATKRKVAKRKSKAAPYGYKKDGTPKKRPGRPAK